MHCGLPITNLPARLRFNSKFDTRLVRLCTYNITCELCKMSDHKYCNLFVDHSNVDNRCAQDDVQENETIKEINELLIQTIRGYPHLYDHKSKDFKDNLMKENSWKEVALSTNMSVNDCRIRWTRLRERFGREKLLRETTDTRSGSGATRRPLFPFYESMLFLENHIKRRKTFTNVSSSKQSKIVNCTSTQVAATIQKESSEKSTHLPELSLEFKDELPKDSTNIIQPPFEFDFPNRSCTNFSPTFGKNHSQRPVTSSVLMAPEFSCESYLDDSGASTSSFLPQDAPPSPASSTASSKIMTHRAKAKKKLPTSELENSLSLLCQTMHQRITTANNSATTRSSDIEIFGMFVAKQLERLPDSEKIKRQKAITEILFEPYP